MIIKITEIYKTKIFSLVMSDTNYMLQLFDLWNRANMDSLKLSAMFKIVFVHAEEITFKIINTLSEVLR